MSEARSLYVATNRSVRANESTVLTALAVARALDRPLSFSDVSDSTVETVRLCAIRIAVSLDERDVLSFLALGGRGGVADLAAAVEDETTVLVVRTTETRRVRIDEGVALAALSARASGAVVRLADVLDVEVERSTTRTLERNVSLDRADAIAALALGGLRANG